MENNNNGQNLAQTIFEGNQRKCNNTRSHYLVSAFYLHGNQFGDDW